MNLVARFEFLRIAQRQRLGIGTFLSWSQSVECDIARSVDPDVCAQWIAIAVVADEKALPSGSYDVSVGGIRRIIDFPRRAVPCLRIKAENTLTGILPVSFGLE